MNSEMGGNVYIVAGTKPWNRRIFDEILCECPGKWHFIGDPEKLNIDTIDSIKPRFIFFLHWSSKVPDEIVNQYECICFHMTDLPYGRGGSPLQNLILRGHKQTKLTALRMVEEFDAGPVYLKDELNIGNGPAEEIYIRSSYVAARMIKRIISQQIEAVPQTGEVSIFKRRRPEESEIPDLDSPEQLYDFIRMLDAEGYPRAFIGLAGFRYEFSNASLYDGKITANVIITMDDDAKE